MWAFWFLVPIVLLACVAVHDRRQRSNTIMANFPIIGRFRYWFEALGGPLRQYIVTNNDEERPFTRDQRRWVYASAQNENNYFGFGTDNELEQTTGYLIIRQSTFPISSPVKGMPGYDPQYRVPCAKILGGYRGRKHAFRPASIINTSAMSYGSLSGAAIESINRGVALAGAFQNTGEGGISPHHRKGGDLMWQLGTGYYGCRDENGNFSMDRFLEGVQSAPVKAIEIKLSQGAKPGLGGVLPAAKITPEISAIRHVPMGKDCISPASHGAFSDVSSMLDFIERLADASGLPVGIKAAVGQMGFWHDLAKQMESTGRAPDFITIDGGEGGTGAAPLVFSDHVALPFKLGFTSVYRAMAERGMHEKVVFIGAGRLGFPQHFVGTRQDLPVLMRHGPDPQIQRPLQEVESSIKRRADVPVPRPQGVKALGDPGEEPRGLGAPGNPLDEGSPAPRCDVGAEPHPEPDLVVRHVHDLRLAVKRGIHGGAGDPPGIPGAALYLRERPGGLLDEASRQHRVEPDSFFGGQGRRRVGHGDFDVGRIQVRCPHGGQMQTVEHHLHQVGELYDVQLVDVGRRSASSHLERLDDRALGGPHEFCPVVVQVQHQDPRELVAQLGVLLAGVYRLEERAGGVSDLAGVHGGGTQ